MNTQVNQSAVAQLNSAMNFTVAPQQPTRSDLIAELEQKGAFYDVQLEENYWMASHEDGYRPVYKTTGKKTVVNKTLNEVIGIVSSQYVPVLNKDIFEQFDKVLLNCEGIDLTGAYTEVQTNGNGARIMVNYVLPAHTLSLNNGDEVALTITALNSFDGSTGFKVFCGGLRFKCLNGMILGDKVASYQKKHCAGLSITAAGAVIETGLKAYIEGVDSWNNQMKTAFTAETAWSCLAEFAGMGNGATEYKTKEDFDARRNKSNADGSARKLVIDSYFEILKQYTKEFGGDTEWALNNALTHIATHGLREAKPSIQSQITKTELARKLINKYLNKG